MRAAGAHGPDNPFVATGADTADLDGPGDEPIPYWDRFSGTRTRLDLPPPWAGLPAAARRGIRVDAARRAFERRKKSPDAPSRPGVRKAAVLVALFEEAGETRLFLIKRSVTVSTHQGEVAFPGGERDVGEASGPAALREAWEEIGLDPASVELIGELGRQEAVLTNYQITPVVGVLQARPALRINNSEVQQAFDISLAGLMVDGVYRQERWNAADSSFTVPFFELPHGSAWGVTALMLLELLEAVTGA
ncbi:CoA pyrophosphatase [Frankia sp. Cppng1_Ct_nod]|uniref:NUDIX hydrolase n=1 Tax=Frankia sp. Cppng1_Ct_nod TaxID=2897162 RepID=UPI0010413F5F|nr:CoA pyrophosphatase [Frankia sp. Cppng1_Ct_nod]